MSRALHVVAFAIPHPPDYGGVIDVYYKLRALHDLGCVIHLHCFTYGHRQRSTELEALCASVSYYPRKKWFRCLFTKQPYIIASRQDNTLLGRLVELKVPILFEGVHSAAYITHPDLRDRRKGVRLHNIEWQYYKNLALQASNVFVRTHYMRESQLLKKFELTTLGNADVLFCISNQDSEYFDQYHKGMAHLVNGFHAFSNVQILPGKGDFILIHADFSVRENEESVRALTRYVFKDLPFNVVIAGKEPGPDLRDFLGRFRNIELRANVRTEVMEDLMRKAHLQIVHGMQASGFKIKLIHALFTGRFVAANTLIVKHSGLEGLLHEYNSFEQLKVMITSLMQISQNEEIKEERRKLLYPAFDNLENAKKILSLIE